MTEDSGSKSTFERVGVVRKDFSEVLLYQRCAVFPPFLGVVTPTKCKMHPLLLWAFPERRGALVARDPGGGGGGKYYRLHSLSHKSYLLTVLEARSWRSGCGWGWLVVRAVKEVCVPGVSRCHVDGRLRVHMVCSPSGSVSKFPFLMMPSMLNQSPSS